MEHQMTDSERVTAWLRAVPKDMGKLTDARLSLLHRHAVYAQSLRLPKAASRLRAQLVGCIERLADEIARRNARIK